MRVLLVTPFFYPHKGGSQQYMEELWYTIQQRHTEVEVDVLTYNTNKSPSIEAYRNFTIYRVPCWQVLPGQFAVPNYFSVIRLLWQLSRSKHYDLMSVNTRFFESTWWGIIVAKLLHIPAILTDHCAAFPVHGSHFVSVIARFIDKTISPFFANKYNAVTVTNKATQEFAINTLKIKNPVLLYGGVDTHFFNRHKKYSNDTLQITFVGRMIPSKGPQLLLETAKKLKNISFTFVGDGELLEVLKNENIPNVRFTGSLGKAAIADILQNTDILVHPSVHHEGFPNVLLEAGAAGCAVIATDRGGTTEIIIDDKTGIIVEPTVEDIGRGIQALADKQKRQAFASALQKHVQNNFSWDSVAEEYFIFVKKLL